MAIRSSSNPYGSFSETTDKRIGDAFPVVEAVHARLAELVYIAENAHNLQPGQIELRHVAETKTLEWKYTNQENWNVLVVYEDFSAINNTVLAAADLTAADVIQTGLDRQAVTAIYGSTQAVEDAVALSGSNAAAALANRIQTNQDLIECTEQAGIAAVEADAAAASAAYLDTYVNQVIQDIVLPLDLGLISDPVVYRTIDCGTLV